MVDTFLLAVDGVWMPLGASSWSFALLGYDIGIVVDPDTPPPIPSYGGGGGGYAVGPSIKLPSIKPQKASKSVVITLNINGKASSKRYVVGPKRHKIIVKAINFLNVTSAKINVSIERVARAKHRVVSAIFGDK